MSQQSHGHTHPVTSAGLYIGVFFTLMALTIITVAAAKLELGILNTPIALAIACTKAAVVIWFFMELRHARVLTKLAAATGLVWLAILLIFLFSDYVGRDMLPGPPAWVEQPEATQVH